MHWSREGFGKEIFWLRTWKIWKIDPRRINTKEVLIPQRREEFIFPVADGTVKLFGRDHAFREPTLILNKPQGVKISVENLKAKRKSLNRQNLEMTLEPATIFGLFKVASSIVITMNLECKSVPKEEIFPIPLKYNDVTWCTHTDLVLTIIGTWNTSLSDSWNGFHAVHNIERKTSKGICGLGRDSQMF